MIALARKYRPKRFADLIVQDHVAAALRGAVGQRRVAHGYLFAGPRGTGKTTAARILAMALNCERREAEGVPAGEPCGACDSCTRIWTGATSLDVIELDAASNRGVDDARDLRERAMYAASGPGRSKVYIVDEAHMLTREAWNALLKILEEPPPGVVFVFATTEPQKIAQTAAPVLSRVQRFDFRRIGPQAIVTRLREVIAAEALGADDDALRLIARSADGGMRDALSILDQVRSFGDGPVTAQRVREALGLIPDELYAELLRLVAERDAPAVFPLVDRLLESGADPGEFVSGAGDALRAVLLVGLGGEPAGLTEAMQVLVRQYAPRLPPPDVVRLLTVLGDSETALRQRGDTRLAVELLLLRWTVMDRTVEIEAVLDALGKGDDGRGKGATAPETSADPSARPPVRPSADEPASPSVPPERGAATLERLRGLWGSIVADARARSPILGAVLAHAEVAEMDGSVLTVRLLDDNPVHAEGLERQRDVVAQVVGRYVDAPVRIRSAPRPSGDGARGRPARLTAEAASAERLSALRRKDPSLNAAVDALDLELLE
ncbi:MAG: DNA polymerase III subunit gamma/tau [Gemmatimonadales bacterium]